MTTTQVNGKKAVRYSGLKIVIIANQNENRFYHYGSVQAPLVV